MYLLEGDDDRNQLLIMRILQFAKYILGLGSSLSISVLT